MLHVVGVSRVVEVDPSVASLLQLATRYATWEKSSLTPIQVLDEVSQKFSSFFSRVWCCVCFWIQTAKEKHGSPKRAFARKMVCVCESASRA